MRHTWGYCHFVQTCFHFSLYMVLEQVTSGAVSDPVVTTQVSQIMGAGSNPVVHTISTCYGREPEFVPSKIAL